MTTLQDKTPEELNRTLRELLGWREVDESYEMHGNPVKRISFYDPSGKWHNADMLPPYATSYDAIMPCAKALNKKERLRFIQILSDIRRDSDGPFTWTMVTSSPADLTRALILVLQSK